VDLESLLVALYVLVEEWWEARPKARRGPGWPALLSDAEVLALAVLAQWPRFRSEWDFWRFADAHLSRRILFGRRHACAKAQICPARAGEGQQDPEA
jgi:hypothetical protein